MKKLLNIGLALTAVLAMQAVLAAAGLASSGGVYQYKEPAEVADFRKRNGV